MGDAIVLWLGREIVELAKVVLVLLIVVFIIKILPRIGR